jgi:hypothetical protein
MIELLGYSALSLMIVKLFTPLDPVRERVIDFIIRSCLYLLKTCYYYYMKCICRHLQVRSNTYSVNFHLYTS